MLKYLVTAHAVLKYEPECSSKPDPYIAEWRGLRACLFMRWRVYR